MDPSQQFLALLSALDLDKVDLNDMIQLKYLETKFRGFQQESLIHNFQENMKALDTLGKGPSLKGSEGATSPRFGAQALHTATRTPKLKPGGDRTGFTDKSGNSHEAYSAAGATKIMVEDQAMHAAPEGLPLNGKKISDLIEGMETSANPAKFL